jgi:hypothetical protein
MQNMQAMHEKMMAAKTRAERLALMADHMKAMQEGMDAMQHMELKGGTDSGGLGMMRMRMDMMTMMMQMMMDRQQMGGMMGGGMGGTTSAAPPPAKPDK